MEQDVPGPVPEAGLDIDRIGVLTHPIPYHDGLQGDKRPPKDTGTQSLAKNSDGGPGIESFLRRTDKPALRCPDHSKYITHLSLCTFVETFSIPPLPPGQSANTNRKEIVGIALPNGPLLAALCLAVANRYIAAPLNCDASIGPEQFKADVRQSGATCILTTRADADRLGLTPSSCWITDRHVRVLIVDSGDDNDSEASLGHNLDRLRLRRLDGTPLPVHQQPEPNTADDIAIVLFTSGTSGTKKLVPITVQNIVSGVRFVVDSWDLTADDVCLNMMPLFHIGGLVRNIFAPLFSGGSVICCPAFDPTLFWDVVEDVHLGPTWYYASPSMHQMILEQAGLRHGALAGSKMRLVCNAAGGLLPALAHRLRDTFRCTVLPSYGMTECMPISTPPIDYKLDRPGTSGVAVGPELTILDRNDAIAAPGSIGRICVRGEPVFPGYLKPDGGLDKSALNNDGWFDTGDLGYMAPDGFLFITGRSKEVINRGGEIISPFEVENAIIAASHNPESPMHNRVSQALAFSVSHDVLQEVVGVVLVTPASARRVDVRQLHQALKSSLQQAKWPAVIVYMDDIPRRNNKVLRIKLGERLGLPEITNDTLYINHHFQATCPAPDTDLAVNIPSTVCQANLSELYPALIELLPAGVEAMAFQHPDSGLLEVYLASAANSDEKSTQTQPDQALVQKLKAELSLRLPGYTVPHSYAVLKQPFHHNDHGNSTVLDRDTIQRQLQAQRHSSVKTAWPIHTTTTTTTTRVARIFASTLNTTPDEISHTVDFFSLGGDSLRAGRLLSALRAAFAVSIPIELVFRGGSVAILTTYIDAQLAAAASPNLSSSSDTDTDLPDKPPPSPHSHQFKQEKTHSSTRPTLLLLQLVPLVLLYPARRGAQWTLFLLALAYTKTWPTSQFAIGRLLNIVVCLLFARVVIRATVPFVGIVVKWAVIGRYREGVYPMWGVYHTRWWIVQKTVDVCGLGFWGSTDMTRTWYYRLMGAKIGTGVKFHGTQLGEWDLLTIGDGAELGKCLCRPFAVEHNTSMYLGRITIGRNASVGLASPVAPGTRVPDDACIGPNSSSWELRDATEANRDLAPHRAPKPHWVLSLLLTLPIAALAQAVRSAPWMLGLLGLVVTEPAQLSTPLVSIIHWWAGKQRVLFHFLALGFGTLFGPGFLFVFALLVMHGLDLMFGKLGPSKASTRGQVERWRLALVKTLFPGSALHDLTGLFGQHYGMTSAVLRLLGARVGQRVYWPGTGPGIGDYHLIDVGDDVVFGSRAHLVTSDGTGSERIVIKNGAMIADRVTCLPGVVVGEGAILGSGALAERGARYSARGVFVGSRGGKAMCLSLPEASPEKQPLESPPSTPTSFPHSLSETIVGSPSPSPSTSEKPPPPPQQPQPQPLSTPFGRAFYHHQAPYHVLSPLSITLYSSTMHVLTSVYWNIPFIASVQLFDHLIRHGLIPLESASTSPLLSPLLLFGLFTCSFAILITAQALLAILVVIAAKWALLGRRSPGTYSWDTSSYCQRWQAFLAIEGLRRHCFRGHGIIGMLTGTHWCVLYFRALGASIGKDCALFANGRPGLLFTEPDLLTLGDRVAVDDASLVGHVNTRGKFDLNRLEVGDRCVLRSGSRLLSGAVMRADSCLLEHTLVMGGEVVEEGVTMQGWPAAVFTGERVVVGGEVEG
ncbi:hypothetical protein B0T22DRAFT_424389 [Podospora appendiculata]|uniref:Carrier domain-containing protein n=1 Tax=Podospora appendiculata TaxID=314037 RepID=A0AAE1CE70_9PEZI|nr:hypothetical protein B0T22DRAFT_424389 [Podospora appendiculata]